jgi:solute carrier family 25 protein 33/36
VSRWRTTEEDKLLVRAWVHFLGGGLGAMMGAILTSPLEVIKTRKQAFQNTQLLTSNSIFGTNTILSIRGLWRREGIYSLYRGLGTHLAGVIPARSIHFFVYGTSKRVLTQKLQTESWIIPIISSAMAGATVVTFTSPIWLVKTRLQLQTLIDKTTLYNNPWHALKTIIENEGCKALFKGMSASYLGLTETVIQFSIYESMKSTELQYKRKTDNQASLNVVEFLILSSFSKLIASFLTYPHEVIRTRLREQRSTQARYTGPLQGLRLIAQEEGIKGLYAGMSAHLLRVVPNAAILFLTYEFTLAYFCSLEKKRTQE